jgi:uncharacterized protein YkwD
MPRTSVTRTITAALAVFAAVGAIGTSAQARPAGMAAMTDACPGSDTPVAQSTPGALRKSVRCLISAIRSDRALPKLVRDDSLELAARRHVRTMINTDCLAHKCPNEVDLERRLRRAGYLDGATTFRFAESTGCGTSAASMVSSWMSSPFDRASILDAGFEDLGVFVSDDASKQLCGDGYGTFAVVYGSRSP